MLRGLEVKTYLGGIILCLLVTSCDFSKVDLKNVENVKDVNSLIKGRWVHETDTSWNLYFTSEKVYDYSSVDTILSSYQIVPCDSFKYCLETWYKKDFYNFRILALDTNELILQQDIDEYPVAVFYREFNE